MKSFLKKFHIRFFDWPLDFRVRLFHILAFGGIAISFFTVTISLIMGMWETAGLAAVLSDNFNVQFFLLYFNTFALSDANLRLYTAFFFLGALILTLLGEWRARRNEKYT